MSALSAAAEATSADGRGWACAGLRKWLLSAECGLAGTVGVLAADDALARFVAEDVCTVADVARLDPDDLEDLGFEEEVRDLLVTAIQALRDTPSVSSAASAAPAAASVEGAESKTQNNQPAMSGVKLSTKKTKKTTTKQKRARRKPRYVEPPPSAAAQAAFAALEHTLQAEEAARKSMTVPDLNGRLTCKRCGGGEAHTEAEYKAKEAAANARPSKLQNFMNRLETLVGRQEEVDKERAEAQAGMTEEQFQEEMKRDMAEVTSRVGEFGVL